MNSKHYRQGRRDDWASVAATFYGERFTLVELLVVIAIIAVLMTILLPSLNKAKETAKLSVCTSNLKQFGVAASMYSGDYEGYLAVGNAADKPRWQDILGDYVAPGRGFVKPMSEPGNIWTCPENPEGEFFGNSPSYSTTNAHMTPTEFGITPLKLTAFKCPSVKVHLFEADHWNTRLTFFYAQELGGRLRYRHRRRCNIAFVDGHIKAYGYPPLPFVKDSALARKWVMPGEDAPDGL